MLVCPSSMRKNEIFLLAQLEIAQRQRIFDAPLRPAAHPHRSQFEVGPHPHRKRTGGCGNDAVRGGHGRLLESKNDGDARNRKRAAARELHMAEFSTLLRREFRRRLGFFDRHAAGQAGTENLLGVFDLGPNAALAVHRIAFRIDEHDLAVELASRRAGQIDRQRHRPADEIAADFMGVDERLGSQPVQSHDPHDDIARLHPFAALPLDLHDHAAKRRDDAAMRDIVRWPSRLHSP